MNMLLNGAVILVGLLAWGIAYIFWRRPAGDPWLLKLIYFLAVPVLFQVGYALVMKTAGLDHWDDAGALQWDSWLGFGLATVLGFVFAVTRFRGGSRGLFTLLSLGWIAYPLWLYLRA